MALDLMAAAIPSPQVGSVRVLDMCCGPGDAGRAVFSRFPNARIDFVDRDPFFASLCSAINERDRISGETLVRDLLDPGWHRDCMTRYDVIIVANGLHWFRMDQATRVVANVRELLRPGGSFLFLEPVSPETPFASGVATWRQAQPSQHKREDWIGFWSSVNGLLGYEYFDTLAQPDENGIGDQLSVFGWVGLLKAAGFDSIDVLLRDPEKVVVAALKPS